MKNIIDYLKGFFPEDAHQRIFLVGGAVRDILLSKEHTDIDLSAALTTEEFAALGFRLVEGKSTAAIWHRHIEGFGTIEATPLPDVAALREDLQRRDFTINAMAMTLAGDLVDPLGGSTDLEHARLAPCNLRTFIDDPLRVFRAFRFAADGWRMTAGCEMLLREREWNRELSSVPVERFSREMLKALEAAEPERYFQLMLEMAAGQGYLPELFRMPHVPAGPLEHHPEGDLFTHSLQVLHRAAAQSGDPLARFCAFFHDIGKLATDSALYPRHHGHEQAGFEMALEFCQRLRLPTQYGKALSWVSRLHGTFSKWSELRDSTKLRMADQAIKAGIVETLPLVAAADKTGGTEPEEWRAVVRIAGMATAELGMDRELLEQVDPGRRSDAMLQARIRKLRGG